MGALTVLFHLVLIFYGLVPNLVARPIHMALALPWVLFFTSTTRISKYSGILFSILGVSACFWIAINHSNLSDQYGSLEGDFQICVATVLLLVVIEAARPH